LFVAQADPDSVYRALKAFGCHWKNKRKKEETRPINPKAPSKNMAKPWFSNRQLAVGFRTGLTLNRS